jgi:hypothetical protein
MDGRQNGFSYTNNCRFRRRKEFFRCRFLTNTNLTSTNFQNNVVLTYQYNVILKVGRSRVGVGRKPTSKKSLKTEVVGPKMDMSNRPNAKSRPNPNWIVATDIEPTLLVTVSVGKSWWINQLYRPCRGGMRKLNFSTETDFTNWSSTLQKTMHKLTFHLFLCKLFLQFVFFGIYGCLMQQKIIVNWKYFQFDQ